MHITTSPVLITLFKPLIIFCRWLGRRNPILLVKLRYFFRFKRFLNLRNPVTLNEKILYQSLKTDIGLRTKLTDKWLVREYVKECGFSEILVQLFGVWDRADEIDFDTLPSQFVLKPNHGSGDIIIVRDKSLINKDSIVAQLNDDLRKAGYRTATQNQVEAKCGIDNKNTSEYFYCVYLNDESSIEGYTYEVVTYIHFNFPVIGDMLTFAVKGETKVLGKVYDY
jgi:hypothetical protein